MSRRASIVLGSASLLLLLGCARKAPGPDQCVPFVEMLIGAKHEEIILAFPRAKADFDALVTVCLTEPFDQRVFACTIESHAPRACLLQYGPKSLKQTSFGRSRFERPPTGSPQLEPLRFR